MDDLKAYWQLIKGRRLYADYKRSTVYRMRERFKLGTTTVDQMHKILERYGYVCKKRAEWIKPRKRGTAKQPPETPNNTS